MVPHAVEVLRRVADADPRVRWTRFAEEQAAHYDTDQLFGVRINRKWRIMVSARSGPVAILGFVHRGNCRGIYQRER